MNTIINFETEPDASRIERLTELEKKHLPAGSTPANMTEMERVLRLASVLTKQEDAALKETKTWSDFEFQAGDVISATSPDNNKAILLVSWGNEKSDVEQAKMAGIEQPLFGYAEYWFRRHAPQGFVLVQDVEAGVNPPQGSSVDWSVD